GRVYIYGGVTSNPVTENNDIIFTKTDNQGNITWSRIYKGKDWGHGSGSNDYYYVQQMKQDPYTGDIFITGPTWAAGKSLLRLNNNNGDIVWSKLYAFYNSQDRPFGIDVK